MLQRLICLFVISLLVVSCRTEVQDSFPDFEKKLTFNAILVVGDTLKVHVSLADKLDSSRLGIIDNATIGLYTDNEFVQNLIYADSGIYVSDIVVQSKKEYTCKVSVTGYEEVNGSQMVPKPSATTKIEHINIAGKDEEGTSYPAVKITFQNKSDEEAYYEVEIRYNQYGTIYTANIQTIVDPVILNEGLPIALFNNKLIQDSIYTLILNYTTNGARSSNGGPIRTVLYPFVVELRSVTYDYYRFKKQLYLYEQGRLADGILTSMTNANLYSNIENGYGIFAGYSSFVSDTITPNTDGYYE